MCALPPDEPSIAAAGADPGRGKAASYEVHGVESFAATSAPQRRVRSHVSLLLNQRHRGGASQSAVEALAYTHSLAGLENPDCARRLVDASDRQLRDVLATLIRLTPAIRASKPKPPRFEDGGGRALYDASGRLGDVTQRITDGGRREYAGNKRRNPISVHDSLNEAAAAILRHKQNRGAAVRDNRQSESLRRLMADDVFLAEAWYEVNVAAHRRQAAASTVDALVYQLRRGGIALSDPGARRRLSDLSEQQLHEVSARLQKFKPHIARAWTPTEIESLVRLWSSLHG
jgi:hypothetical protein